VTLGDVLVQAMQPIVEAAKLYFASIGDGIAAYRRSWHRQYMMRRALPRHAERAVRLRTPALPAPMAMLLLSDGKERDQ